MTGSTSVTVHAGAATHITASAPSSAIAGNGFNLTVTAFDLYANVATGYSGTLHFTSSDGQSSLPANANLTNGSGVFFVNLKSAGNQSITATDTLNATLAATVSVAVSPAAASFYVVATPTVATAGDVLSLDITTFDAYGNVGTSRRLDFTVIGRAVNEASRIEELCGQTGRSILISESFAERCGRELEPVGTFTLRGIERKQSIWTVAPTDRENSKSPLKSPWPKSPWPKSPSLTSPSLKPPSSTPPSFSRETAIEAPRNKPKQSCPQPANV